MGPPPAKRRKQSEGLSILDKMEKNAPQVNIIENVPVSVINELPTPTLPVESIVSTPAASSALPLDPSLEFVSGASTDILDNELLMFESENLALWGDMIIEEELAYQRFDKRQRSKMRQSHKAAPSRLDQSAHDGDWSHSGGIEDDEDSTSMQTELHHPLEGEQQHNADGLITLS